MRHLCFLLTCTNLILGGLVFAVHRRAVATEALVIVITAQLCVNHPTHALCGGAP